MNLFHGTVKALITLVVLISSSCSSISDTSVKREIRISVSRSYESWIDKLIEIYKTRLDNTIFTPKELAGSVSSVDLLETGELDVAIAGAHIAYLAFINGTDAVARPHRKLRGMAVLTVSAMHLIAAPGAPVQNLKDLKGKRVSVGPAGSGTEFTARILLSEFGINSTDLEIMRLPFEEVPAKLADGSLDAEFIQVSPSSPAPFAKEALAIKGAALIPIQGQKISTLREKYPFFRPVVIPAGTYGQHGDTETVGMDFVLVCREDLSEDAVYDMLKIFFESLPELTRHHTGLGSMSFQQRSGLPIPLHSGAARFYRERELFR